jgi:hypothetical protein
VDRHNRPSRFAAGATLVALTAVAVVEWPRLRAWQPQPGPDLPAPADVVRMRAAVWASGSNGNLKTDIPWFTVPGGAAPRIWKRFRPNAYVANPPVNRDAPLGELVVTTRDGRATLLRFYETGPNEVVFSVDGQHFYRAEPRDDVGSPLGGGLLLAGTLRHAAAVAENGGRLPNGEVPGCTPPAPRPAGASPTAPGQRRPGLPVPWQ